MFLGLDLGTTNIKAVVTEPDGRIVARGSAPVKVFHVGEGGVEQDIDDIWSATLAAIAEAGAAADLTRVRAAGVSSQGGALQMLDGTGGPVGRVISWLDGRGRPYDDAITDELGGVWFARHVGHGRSGMAVGQLLRLSAERPELARAPNAVGFVGDVIVSRLCGRRAHDATSLSIAMLFNPRRRTADAALLGRLAVGEGQLPGLLAVCSAAGPLLADVANATGLRPGIPVSPAVHDQYAAALGVGAVRAGDVMFGAGTAWVLLAAASSDAGPIDPVVPQAYACTHLLEGLYGQLLSLGNGGSAVTWVMDLLGMSERGSRDADSVLAAAPAGSDGLRFWPFLVPNAGAGLKPGTTGRLLGLRLSHGRAHLVRAVVEGLALELVRYVRFLTAGGLPVERLVMCGGAAASRLTPQILADAAGLPIACATESDTSALGAAVIARALAEPGADLGRLSKAMSPETRPFKPGSDAGLYRRLFEEYVASLPMACSEEGDT